MFSLILAAHKLEGNCDISVGAPSIINKEPCLSLAKKAVENSFGVNALTPLNAVNFGADFGYYLEDIPGCFLQVPDIKLESLCPHIIKKLFLLLV